MSKTAMGKTRKRVSLYTFESPFLGNENIPSKIIPGNEKKLQNLITAHVSGVPKNRQTATFKSPLGERSHGAFAKSKDGRSKAENITKQSTKSKEDVYSYEDDSNIISQDVLHVKKESKDYSKPQVRVQSKTCRALDKRKIQIDVLGTIFKMKNELRIIRERRHKLWAKHSRKDHALQEE